MCGSWKSINGHYNTAMWSTFNDAGSSATDLPSDIYPSGPTTDSAGSSAYWRFHTLYAPMGQSFESYAFFFREDSTRPIL